jgi:hypothetical protein
MTRSWNCSRGRHPRSYDTELHESCAPLSILQAVVRPILKAVLARHPVIGFGSGVGMGILPPVIRIGVTTILVALIVSRLVGTAIVRILGCRRY